MMTKTMAVWTLLLGTTADEAAILAGLFPVEIRTIMDTVRRSCPWKFAVSRTAN